MKHLLATATLLLMATTASAGELMANCRHNYPGTRFVAVITAAEQGENLIVTLDGDSRRFQLELPSMLSDFDPFSITLAAGMTPPNLVAAFDGRNIVLYGPVQTGTAGKYDDEETAQMFTCKPLSPVYRIN